MNVLKENNYLEHYGVLGMKWGVHKSEKEERRAIGDAYKLAKLKSKQHMKAGKLQTTANVMAYTNSYGNKKMQKLLRNQEKSVNKAQKKADAFAKKIAEKYKNTKYSDIHVSDPYVKNGRTYCDVGFGLVYIDQEDGIPIFNAYASVGTKNEKPGTRG